MLPFGGFGFPGVFSTKLAFPFEDDCLTAPDPDFFFVLSEGEIVCRPPAGFCERELATIQAQNASPGGRPPLQVYSYDPREKTSTEHYFDGADIN
jgi:hypothetical protein